MEAYINGFIIGWMFLVFAYINIKNSKDNKINGPTLIGTTLLITFLSIQLFSNQ